MVYVTVRHGSNEETLFNQDCRCITLLNAIREKCCDSSNSNDVIDLSDKDGNVKDLRKYPNMTAKDVLGDREDCVLLKIGENQRGKLMYTPLLENEDIVTKAFLDKLAKGSKREAAGKTGGGKGGPSVAGGSKASGAGGTASSTTAAASFGKKMSGSASGQSQGNKRR